MKFLRNGLSHFASQGLSLSIKDLCCRNAIVLINRSSYLRYNASLFFC